MRKRNDHCNQLRDRGNGKIDTTVNQVSNKIITVTVINATMPQPVITSNRVRID